MIQKVVFPSFRENDYSQYDMRQLVSALELRFQALEANVEGYYPSVEDEGFDDQYAAASHTHLSIDITDLSVPESIFDLNDVTGSPSVGEGLIWNGVAFEASAIGGGAITLDELSDVNAGAPTDGQALVWDVATLRWIPGTAPVGIDKLFDLTDTDISGQLQGDILYNADGSEWQASGTNFQWLPSLSRVQLGSNHSINWYNIGSGSVELLILNLQQIGSTSETIPDLDTLVYDSVSTAADLNDDPFGMWIAPDGLTVFVGDIAGNQIEKYPLGTAWDVTTIGARSQTSITIGAGVAYYPTGLFMNPDGTKVFVGTYGNGDIQTHTLSSAYDLSTLSATPDSGETLNVWASSNLTGIYFASDGFNVAAVSDGTIVKTYSMSVAFTLSTASLSGTIDISANPAASNGLVLSNDGATMWLLIRGAGRLVYQYTLSTPWDASTATYDSKTYLITYNVSSPNLTGAFIEPVRGEFYCLAKPGAANTAVIEKAVFTPQGLTPVYAETFVVGDPSYQLNLHGNQIAIESNVGLNWVDSGDNLAELIILDSVDDFVLGNALYDTFLDGLTVDIRAAGTEIVSINTAGMTLPDKTLTIAGTTPANNVALAHDDTDLNTVFANTTDWNITGITAVKLTGAYQVNDAAGPTMVNEAATSTNPTLIPNVADLDSGIMWAAADQVGFVAGAIEAIRYSEASSHVIVDSETHTGITAGTTQTQVGGFQLLSSHNEVATVGTTNDTVVAPLAVAGRKLTILNNGANTLQIFPAVGDDIGAGVDTAITLAAAGKLWFVSYDATTWTQFV